MRIGEFLEEENTKALTRGRIQGTIFGALAIVGVKSIVTLAINKRKKKASHEAEGKEILKVIESSRPTLDSPIDTNDSNDIDTTDDTLSESFDPVE